MPFVLIQIVMVAMIIIFPNLVAYDKPDANAAKGPEIDIQQMIQQDAEHSNETPTPPPATQDDDALNKALKDANSGK